jgi:hypothetical protein
MTSSTEAIDLINQHFYKDHQLRHEVELAERDQSLNVQIASIAARIQF